MARKPKESTQIGAIDLRQSTVPEQITASQAINSVMDTQLAVHLSRCGGALKQERERQKLSTQDIASQLRLSNKQIEALEADNFSLLPEATIVKGFIRNYAKALKLNAQPLLDAYGAIVPEATKQSISLKPTADMRVTNFEETNYKKWMIILVGLVLALAVWFFYGKYVQKPSPITPSASLTEPASKEPLPEAALPAAERAGGYDAQQNVPLPPATSAPEGTESANVPSNSAPIDANASAALPNAPAASTTSNSPQNQNVNVAPAKAVPPEPSLTTSTSLTAAQEASSNTATGGLTKLAFDANQETWISVVDAQGREIYNKTLFAGNHEVIEVKKPLNIVVGNAHGATLNVDGKLYDLAPHTRVNVARVKID